VQNYYETPESIEARAILRLVSIGTTTLEAARDLIAVPEREEHVLQIFAAIAGKDGAPIGRALAFRRKVMAEFEKLISQGQFEAALPA
jgi:hypothetical protein